MEYKKLIETDFKVSRIGFGCWAIGGHGYGNIDDMESIRAIKKALDCGINFFDTANVYGFGHSEKVIGRALMGYKGNAIIASKFGLVWNENGKISKDCSPGQIVSSLDGSLKRMQLDCLPLFQLHWHDGKTPIDSIMETLIRLQTAGKIRHIGFCNFPMQQIAQTSYWNQVVSVQYLYNVGDRSNERNIEFAAKELGMCVLAYSVIGRGIYSGKYGSTSCFPANDTRSKDNSFTGKELNRNISIVGKLAEIAAKYNRSSSEVAIRWVLEKPNLGCVLTGIKNEFQAKENSNATEWKLEAKDKEALDSIILIELMEETI